MKHETLEERKQHASKRSSNMEHGGDWDETSEESNEEDICSRGVNPVASAEHPRPQIKSLTEEAYMFHPCIQDTESS